MDNLILAKTKSTPEIAFDAATGILSMAGESHPENSFVFFRPILGWLDEFLEHTTGPVVFNAHLEYLNTGSTKCLMDILDKLEDAHRAGRPVKVNWYYDAENDRSLSNAEEFKEEVTLPFHINPLTK